MIAKLYRPALLTMAVVLGTLASSSCSKTQRVEARDSKPSDLPVVAVSKVTLEDLSRGMVLTAEFKPFQEIDVMAKVAGYVKNIRVDVGDRVNQGDLLATLEVPELDDDQARAQSMLKRSQAELARARDELQRAQSSHHIAHLSYSRLADVAKKKAGLVAQQEIDDAQGKDLVAESQVSAARSSLAAAEQQVQVSTAELEKIKTMLEYTRVTAPFTGVITKRYADTGSMIQAGTSSSTQVMPLVKLSQNSLLRLILPVPESAVPTVHTGQQVEVRVASLNRSFPGRVARFADRVLTATRTMNTEVDVPNPDLVLIPGMFAEVNLTLDKRSRVLALPIPAVETGTDETAGRVLLVTPDGHVQERTVRLGMQNATHVEIRSGLSDGDLVVNGNRGSLRPGEQVRTKLVELGSLSTQ